MTLLFSPGIARIFIMFVSNRKKLQGFFVGLALVGKDIVFRFIIEYSSLRALDP